VTLNAGATAAARHHSSVPEQALALLSPAFDGAYEAGRRLAFEAAVALALDSARP
jgi:hypothetical protein